MLELFDSKPKDIPMLNVGGPFDIATGTFLQGKNGEWILNGGVGHTGSIAGPANSFKSVLALFLNMSVAERYRCFQESIYDSENSYKYKRFNDLCKRFPRLSQIDHGDPYLTEEEIKFKITSAGEALGEKYFDKVKELSKTKIKNRKNLMIDTPFIDSRGKTIQIVKPTGILIDSLSALDIGTLNEKTVDKNEIGASGNNMIYMKQGIAKKQLINGAMHMGPTSGMYFTFVAHIGDEFEMDPYAPKKHKLTHSKKGSKTTGTTKAFEYINEVIYEIFDAKLLNNKERDTGVLYPVLDSDRKPGTTDLLLLTVKPTRNKGGESGASIELIVSQREGFLPHLTQFHHCKKNEWGIVGNNVSYAASLYPDVKLSRTTVRGLIDNDPLLRRALEIQSQMLQISQTWAPLPDDLMCTPEELYEDIKKLGYDWNVLLNTRGYWVFLEDEKDELPFLSTLDLLRMRKGLYHPYWLKEKK